MIFKNRKIFLFVKSKFKNFIFFNVEENVLIFLDFSLSIKITKLLFLKVGRLLHDLIYDLLLQ